jgi:hypothetical protein
MFNAYLYLYFELTSASCKQETFLTLWIVLIEHLPMLSSFSSRGRRNGFGPRTVGGDPLRWAQSSRSGNPGYKRDNMLIDEPDDDWEGDGEY